MTEIYNIDNLEELKLFLENQSNTDRLREELFADFLRYADYKNVSEWNKAVKLCESLAIIGWGKHEPLEAIRGMFFNGNPETSFRNKFGECRFVEAIWSKRTAGFTMEQDRTSYYFSPDQEDEKQTKPWQYEVKEDIQDLKIDSQRNWIPKNPIRLVRGISNCYENSKTVIESIENDLQKELNLNMQPEKYGNAINQIYIHHSHSYYDNNSCKTNHIIADEKLQLKKKDFYPHLLKMFPADEIEKNGYYLRNRFEFGPFKSNTGRVKIDIHFEKQFSELSYQEQKEKFSEHVSTALNTIVGKLKKKKLAYNFDLMFEDFSKLINEWKTKELAK